MLRYSCVALLMAALLMLSCSWREADAAPFFGLLSLIAARNSNGTSTLGNLAIAGLQTKINALETIADLIAIATSSTG